MRVLAVALLLSCGSPLARSLAPAPWQRLTIEWSFGPCDPNGTRSCHQELRVTSDGNATTEETPPSPSTPKITKSSNLTIEERAWVDKILSSTDFRKGMDDGFPCPGSQDARTVIRFERGR